MDSQELFDKYKLFAKRNLLVLALGLVGLILFAYGLISLFLASRSDPQGIVFEAKETSEENLKAINLTIDIEGSVVKPGVYRLPLNSRIQDALIAAHGLSASADRDFIAKTINLAAKLSDGAKIYIPSRGEVPLRETNSAGVISASGLININSASEQELDSLPGIGPVTAQKIIAGRPYSSINDLLDKNVVGSKVFEQIKEKIAVY